MLGTNPDAIEAWAFDAVVFEHLLKRLTTYGRVVLLSGDVHNSSGDADELLAQGRRSQPARIAQFTSSGFKNVMPAYIAATDRTAGFAQQMVRANLGTERIGWDQPADDLVLLPEGRTIRDLVPVMRSRLQSVPVMLPTWGWPDDNDDDPTTAVDPALTSRLNPDRPPDWRWRIRPLLDERDDIQRPAPIQQLPIDPDAIANDLADPSTLVHGYQAIAARHQHALDRMRNARQILFAPNFGLVRFEPDDVNGTDRRDPRGLHGGPRPRRPGRRGAEARGLPGPARPARPGRRAGAGAAAGPGDRADRPEAGDAMSADRSFFQQRAHEVVEFFEFVIPGLAEGLARQAIIRDLGGTADLTSGTADFPTANLDAIKAYRDAAQPGVDADLEVMRDILVVLDAIASNVETWELGPAQGGQELGHSLLDLFATNYVRHQFPRVFMFLQAISAIEDATSTFGPATAARPGWATPSPRSAGSWPARAAPSTTWTPPTPRSTWTPTRRSWTSAWTPECVSAATVMGVLDGIFEIGLLRRHAGRLGRPGPRRRLAPDPPTRADVISSRMISFSIAHDSDRPEDQNKDAERLQLSLLYVPKRTDAPPGLNHRQLFLGLRGGTDPRRTARDDLEVHRPAAQRRRRRRPDLRRRSVRPHRTGR